MKKISFIGTGIMGSFMIKNLSKKYKVNVYNRTIEKAKKLESICNVFENIVDCVKDSDIVFTMLSYPSDVKEVYDVLFENVKEGTILIDCTTSSPTLAKEIYEKGIKRNIRVLDAPVSGGDKGARDGTLSIMVGGDEKVYEEALDVLSLMGNKLEYMGPCGSGQLTKLANQIVIASNLIGVCEGLLFSKKHNLDLNKCLKIFDNGAAGSWQVMNSGLKMINHDKTPSFYVKHFIKDLNLAIEEKLDLDLSAASYVLNVFKEIDLMYPESSTQIIFEYFLSKYNL